MNLDFSVVIDKSLFSKFVHEEAHPRSSGADHFRQRSLAEGHRDRHRTVFVAEIRQKQEKASEASFAGIEQLVDRVIFDAVVSRQQISQKNAENFGSFARAASIAVFAMEVTRHSSMAWLVPLRDFDPSRHPSPKN